MEDPRNKVDEPKKPAFPTNARMHSDAQGLTKREYFAAKTMQSIAAVVFSGYNEAYQRQLLDWQGKYGKEVRVREAMAKDAVELADELLKALDK